MRFRLSLMAAALSAAALAANAQTAAKGFIVPENATDVYAAQRAVHVELEAAVPPGVGAAQAKTCDPKAKKFSWRDHGKVTGAKFQSSCGSCWAFASVSAIETSYMVYHDTNVLIPDLSEQEVLDCAQQHSVFPAQIPYDCSGGWFEGPFRMALTKGVVANGSYPSAKPPGYRNARNKCEAIVGERTMVNSWTPLPSVKGPSNWIAPMAEMKDALCSFGGVAVALNAENFPGGPFTAPISGPTSGTSASQTSRGAAVDHAVHLVGWDDDQGVWIIKNSWGENWGDFGFAKIPYNTRNVGFMATAAQANTSLVVMQLPQAAATNFLNIREVVQNSFTTKIQTLQMERRPNR